MSRRGKTIHTDIEFEMIPWNSSALDDTGAELAVSQESFGGEFIFDVSFKSKHKGFVVQNIRKYKSYTEKASRRQMNRGDYDWGVNYEDCNKCAGPCSHSCYKFLGKNSWEKAGDEECKNLPVPDKETVVCTLDDYWEIFYIGNEGESWNTDRFKQTFLKNESEGTIIQIGYAYFFPYTKSVKQENEVVKLTASIKKLFGPRVGGHHNIAMANGLPSSKTQPFMGKLEPVKNVIVHKLTVKWGKHEPTSKFQRQTEWTTEVTEEAFEGSQLYKEFPWEYKEDRPFYFNSAEWDKIDLDRRKDFRPPEFMCPSCKKVHFKDNWWDYHDDAPSPDFFNEATGLPATSPVAPSRKKTRKKTRKKRRSSGGAGDESDEGKVGATGVRDPSGKEIIAVYPGRFQPMGKHHKKTYEWMAAEFGINNSFIVTSNKISLPKSPLGFEDKRKIAQAMGIPAHNFALEKIVYAPPTFSFLKERDPENTAVVVVIGKKDMEDNPRFKNLDGQTKSGKPAYYRSYDPQIPLEGCDKHGYIIVAPHQDFDVGGEEMSGTLLRKYLPTASDEMFEKLLGISDQETINFLREKLRANTDY